jgi:hypothetical protein
MFATVGVGVFVVDFRERKADGSEVKIDYVRVLGIGDLPYRQRLKSHWRITRWEEGVLRVGDQLCRALGEERDIRVYARRAEKDGWKVHHAAAKNLCAKTRTTQ